MSEPETRLARIDKATLGIEDHGFLTSFLFLTYAYEGEKIGGSGQGFGGRVLGGEYTDLWVRGCLDAVGVGDWSQLPGQMVWATKDWERVYSITGLNTGKTFDPSEWKRKEADRG